MSVLERSLFIFASMNRTVATLQPNSNLLRQQTASGNEVSGDCICTIQLGEMAITESTPLRIKLHEEI